MFILRLKLNPVRTSIFQALLIPLYIIYACNIIHHRSGSNCFCISTALMPYTLKSRAFTQNKSLGHAPRCHDQHHSVTSVNNRICNKKAEDHLGNCSPLCLQWPRVVVRQRRGVRARGFKQQKQQVNSLGNRQKNRREQKGPR